MKKIVLLLMAVFTLASITKAQTKSGILKKDNYGGLTADQWEGLLSGTAKKADEKLFEEKATVKLEDYKTTTEIFVKDILHEKDITTAMDNSVKKPFPADAKVITARSDGSWVTRSPYPGEEGFYHVPTGTYWLSFECGNLCNFKATPKTVQPGSDLTDNGQKIVTNPSGVNLTFNTGNGTNQQGKNDYTDLMLGMSIRQNDMIVDANIFKMMQDMKTCCGNNGGGTSQLAMTAQAAMYAQPAMYVQSVASAPAKVPFGQTFVGNALATTMGVTLGGLLEDAIQGNNRTVRYSGYGYGGYSSNPTIQTNFQGSNQLGFSTAGSGGLMTTTGGYPNGW